MRRSKTEIEIIRAQMLFSPRQVFLTSLQHAGTAAVPADADIILVYAMPLCSVWSLKTGGQRQNGNNDFQLKTVYSRWYPLRMQPSNPTER